MPLRIMQNKMQVNWEVEAVTSDTGKKKRRRNKKKKTNNGVQQDTGNAKVPKATPENQGMTDAGKKKRRRRNKKKKVANGDEVGQSTGEAEAGKPKAAKAGNDNSPDTPTENGTKKRRRRRKSVAGAEKETEMNEIYDKDELKENITASWKGKSPLARGKFMCIVVDYNRDRTL